MLSTFFVILVALLLPSTGIEIVQSPESMAVFAGKEAVFTCQSRGEHYLIWKINGTLLSRIAHDDPLRQSLSVAEEHLGYEIIVYSLTITAKTTFNGTVLQAVTGRFGSIDTAESENATLLVQGLPAPVGAFSVEKGNYSVLLTWSPPFSLNVTSVDSDVWYTVEISNVTDEERPTVINCTDCHNLVKPEYMFSPAHPSFCHVYNFTVIPVNGAGEGGSNQSFVRVGDVNSVHVNMMNFSYDQIFTLALPELADYIHVGVRLTSYDSICGNYTSPLLKEVNSTISFMANYTELPLGCLWNVTIETEPCFGKEISTGNKLDNSRILGGNISAESDAVFVKASLTKPGGCFITFTPKEDGGIGTCVAISDCIKDDGPVIVSGVVVGAYTVRLYDLDGVNVGRMPALKISVDVTDRGKEDSFGEHSSVLDNATITATKSELLISCQFRDEASAGDGCVVVWYTRDDPHLNTVIIYSVGAQFPQPVTVSGAGQYSVAVFGHEEGVDIDRNPVTVQMLTISSDSSFGSPDYTVEVAAAVVILLILVIAVIVTVLVTVWICREKFKVVESTDDHIKTHPNAVYELRKPRRIPVQRNDAYDDVIVV